MFSNYYLNQANVLMEYEKFQLLLYYKNKVDNYE